MRRREERGHGWSGVDKKLGDFVRPAANATEEELRAWEKKRDRRAKADNKEQQERDELFTAAMGDVGKQPASIGVELDNQGREVSVGKPTARDLYAARNQEGIASYNALFDNPGKLKKTLLAYQKAYNAGDFNAQNNIVKANPEIRGLLDNNYRDVVSDKGDYSDVRHTDIAMPVRRWLSGERDIKSLVSNFDKSFTKLGIENNIRKYEPSKPERDPSILGTDDEEVTQPATMGVELGDPNPEIKTMDQAKQDAEENRRYEMAIAKFKRSGNISDLSDNSNMSDALRARLKNARIALNRATKGNDKAGFDSDLEHERTSDKISSAAVRKPGDYEEFDASPDPRNRHPKTFRSASPVYTPIASTSKYEPEATDRFDTGSRSSVNYNQQDIKRLTDLASRSSTNQSEPRLSTALIEPKNTGLGSYFTQKLGQSRKQPATTGVNSSGLNLNGITNSKSKVDFEQEPGKTTSTNLSPDIIRADALKKIPKGNKQDYI